MQVVCNTCDNYLKCTELEKLGGQVHDGNPACDNYYRAKNYFPNVECGSCPVHLAWAAGSATIKEVENTHCYKCNLYKKNIIVFDSSTYMYRDICIKEVYEDNDYRNKPKFEVKGKLFNELLCACDYIDELTRV